MNRLFLLFLLISSLVSNVVAQRSYSYVYDASGNRIQKVITGTVPFPSLAANPASVTTNEASTLVAGGCTGGSYSWSTGHQGVTTLSVYPCTTTNYMVSCTVPSCPNTKSTASVSVEQRNPYTNNILTSEKSGSWNDPTVWCCGRIPTLTDLVIIYPKHQVIISDNTAKAKNIKLEIPQSELKYTVGGLLQIQGN